MKEAKKLWSWLAIPCIALAVLTGSILPVLLVREFYTVQIGPLGICEASGLTGQQAAEAYGDVMDYCMGRRTDFAAGVLPFSAEGASHFADVRGLFLGGLWLRRIGLMFTLAFAALLYFWKRGRKDRSAYLARAVPGSLCAGTGVFFAACLALAAVISTDFSRYFVVFHHIFFDNDLWILDPDTDMLINIVPEAFFMDTALRIAIVFATFVTIFFGACLFLWLKGRKAAEKGGN